MNIIQRLEAFAHKEWDVFLVDIHWLADEARVIAAWAEHADPAVKAQLQALIGDAERAAANIAAKSGTSLNAALAAGIQDAEALAVGVINDLAGSSPVGREVSALAASGIGLLGTLLSDLAKIGLMKALASVKTTAQ